MFNIGRQSYEEIEVPVMGAMVNEKNEPLFPVLGVKMMSDEKWSRLCDQQKKKHPELYAERGA